MYLMSDASHAGISSCTLTKLLNILDASLPQLNRLIIQ